MDMPHKARKKLLRAEALARRDALDAQWRIEASLDMADALRAIDIIPGDIVSGFWPMQSEVDVRPAMFTLREKGARLCLPAILDKTTIVFRELLRTTELVPMGFGTFGPGPDAEIIEPKIMLVPLAAFDNRGHRIGYGAGCYDRALAKRPGALTIGVAYDFQLAADIPAAAHDVPVSLVLTEVRLIRPAPG
jgi:5-formyltetrahydrofolate cyclo-ligase